MDTDPGITGASGGGEGQAPEGAFLYELQRDVSALSNLYAANASIDTVFVVYLRKMARFGFFAFGPITIDVHLVEDLFDRTVERGVSPGPYRHIYDDSYVRFSRRLVEEVRRSGRRRIDELHFLLAFMRSDDGLPARVFGELGVTPEQVEQFARQPREPQALERLYSPEEAADYLNVHVQTVRAWIRSGRLPASRLAGQRALRIRASDLASVLEPVEPGEE